MNFVRLVTMLMLPACMLAACSSRDSQGRETFKVKATTTSVSGPMSEYFNVVDKEYNYLAHGDSLDEIVVDLECVREVPEKVRFGFGVDVFDKSETTLGTSDITVDMEGERTAKFRGLKPGDRVALRIENNSPVSRDAEPVYFRVTSSMLRSPENYSEIAAPGVISDSVASAQGTASAAAMAEWDALLDQYEQNYDKLRSLKKKIEDGDSAAMGEYAAMGDISKAIDAKLTQGIDSMAPAQIERYTRLYEKFIKL